MSCLSSIFNCCLPTKKPTKPEAQTVRDSTSTTPPHHHHTNTFQSPTQGQDQDGYNNVVPLPAYTPRPMSIQEKTLEAHMRDPAISNETYQQYQQQHHHDLLSSEEKQRLAWEEAVSESQHRNSHYYQNYNHPYFNPYPYTSHPRPEEVSSDVSSAISFPSSYGNTSTATRETPPPPYSPPSFSPAPSRSMSISSAYRNPPPHPSQMPPAAITQPPPVFHAERPSRTSIDERLSRSNTPRPRIGTGPARFS
ncbi:hypothetical protein BDW69DRAFT_22691 [Aspergillus filifer]